MIRLAAIQQALEAVPRRCAVCGVPWAAGAPCQLGTPGKDGYLKRLTHTWEADWPALAALVVSWVGPLEESVTDLLTELAWGPVNGVPISASDPACIKTRQAFAALPWRATERSGDLP